MADNLQFGADGKLYYDSADNWASPTWVEIKCVQDKVDSSFGFKEGDATTRRTGVVQTEPTLAEAKIGGKLLCDLGDANYVAFKNRCLSKTKTNMLFCSGAYSVSGNDYVRFAAKCFKFDTGQPIDGIDTVDFELKPCYDSNGVTKGVTPIV